MEVRTESGEPSLRTRWRGPVIIGALPSLLVGWYAIGPSVIFLAVGVAAVVLLLVWSGPRINLRLYAPPRPDTALLHVCSAIAHRDGTLDVEPARIHWTPWKRNASRATPLALDLDEVQTAVIFARYGFPPSCRLELHLADGDVTSITVFAAARAVAEALQTNTATR